MDSRVIDALNGVQTAIAALVASMPAPGYEYPAASLADFQWALNGMKVLHSDERGPLVIEYYGHIYTRFTNQSDTIYTRKRGDRNDILIAFLG